MFSTKNHTVFGEFFLLHTDKAERLYFDYVKDLPIIDYHNHLEPDRISENTNFRSATEIWLDGDHYKWRAMRNFGVEEKYISGNISDEEKFQKWAEVVPFTLRNPLFHWTHMELKNPFGFHEYLNGENASAVYSRMNEALATDDFRPQELLQHFGVTTLCTTDDPCDDLKFHRKLKQSSFKTTVLPAFRPDAYISFSDPKVYLKNISRLEEVSGIAIENADSLLEALYSRIDYFDGNGARISDHGFEYFPDTTKWNNNLNREFSDFLKGNRTDFSDPDALSGYLLKELCKKYAEKGWVQQFHVGATRNNNTAMMQKLGANTGYDAIGEPYFAQRMSVMFDALNSEGKLARSIIYTLNPNLNEILTTLAGNFNEEGIKSKVQFGAAWWFLDQLDGMEKQLNTVSNLGLISTFIGMLTDSRSFLSFSRHEYFRRLLCQILGSEMEKGLLPDNEKWVGSILQDICYYNAKHYFKF